MKTDARGVVAACGAFVMWGTLPVYWKLLGHLSPADLIAHRAVWSLVVLLPLVWCLRCLRGFSSDKQGPLAAAGSLRLGRALMIHGGAAVLLGANWLLYVWATLNDRIIEASLGYFLNPLVNVALGALFLGERMSRAQTIAILFAACGVALQVVLVGQFPWVALSLAFSFALYGLLGKKSPLDSVRGLTLETSLALPIALGWLVYRVGWDWFGGMSGPNVMLVLSLGFVTTAPLLLFGIGARRLPLYVLGILQFIAPTLQFLFGWLIYAEPLGVGRTISFVIIWSALTIFIWSSWSARKLPNKLPSGRPPPP
jgi:chloramphenicol-sensitive protein RarD